MSRTIRRKRGNQCHWWSDPETREWFDDRKAQYQVRDQTHYINYLGVKCTRRWYDTEVLEYRDYNHYVAAYTGQPHRDCKQYGSGVPRDFRNLYCERPLRAMHKTELARAKKSGDWDKVTLCPFMRNAGWLYW